MADRKEQAWGHSICVDLVQALFLTANPPLDWTEDFQIHSLKALISGYLNGKLIKSKYD